VTLKGAGATADSPLTALVVARLHEAGLKGVASRRLGDARGLYHPGDGAPFALVWMGQVYLKAGPETVTRYVAWSMRPYRPGPRQTLRGYWTVPAEVLAEPETLAEWAARAIQDARQWGRLRWKRPRRRMRRSRSEPQDGTQQRLR
jgi:TfoX/Sxy family transcriptional regulator of competence genes